MRVGLAVWSVGLGKMGSGGVSPEIGSGAERVESNGAKIF